jgi:hypothetical protein
MLQAVWYQLDLAGPTRRNRLFFTLLILLLVLGWSVPVYADMGPKPQITIIVKQAPAEIYYLDLLIAEDKNHDNLRGRRAELDQLKLDLLVNYHEDGWYAALAHGTSIPLFGSLTGTRQGGDVVHTFSYHGTPERFKIIIVTPDNQLIVTRELLRQSFHLTLTLDYETGTINQRSLVVAYALQILSTLLPTLLLEGLVLLLFGFSWRQNWKIFLLVNLATQVLLTAVLGTAAITNGLLTAYLLLVPVEGAIILIEAVVFARWLKQHSKARRIAYAITANLIGVLAGMVLMSISLV